MFSKERKYHSAPGPKGHLLWGSLMKIRKDRLAFVNDLTHRFGNIVRFRMGHKTLHLINNPDNARRVLLDNQQNYIKGLGLSHAKPLLGNGLLTSEGELWQQQREMILPALHRGKIDAFTGIMKKETAAMLKSWNDKAGSHQFVNVYEEMKKLTLTILGKTLFNIDIKDKTSELNKTFSLAIEEAIHRMTAMLEISSYLPTPRNFRFRRSLKKLDRIVYDLINQKKNELRQSGDTTNDLLSVLISATDKKTGSKMSDKQLRDELVTMLLAGHETTALTLTWAVYMLAKHPEIQEKLRAESVSFNDNTVGHNTAAEIKEPGYNKAIVEEVMRLYPPVWLIPRRTIKPDVLGGYNIPGGSEVLVCVYTLHRHPDFWDNQDCFIPERFMGDTRKKFSDAYLPFGYGPRSCMGNHFALAEIQLVLSMLSATFSFKLKEGEADIKPTALLTLHPGAAINIVLSDIRNKQTGITIPKEKDNIVKGVADKSFFYNS